MISMKIFAIAALTTFSVAGLAANKTMQIDTTQSKVGWLGKKVTGQHNGSVALKSGSIEMDAKGIKGGQFEIDMTSINNEDLKDAGYNKKLVDHLRSDDFFSVAKHPMSTFVIKSVKPLTGNKDATHEITGDLTIKGITQPVTFPAQVEVKGNKASAKGKVVIDRTKFDVRYGSGKFFQNLGDKMIDDNFEITLDLKTKI
jgi:polyisoprenoid-binding protein YceI